MISTSDTLKSWVRVARIYPTYQIHSTKLETPTRFQDPMFG